MNGCITLLLLGSASTDLFLFTFFGSFFFYFPLTVQGKFSMKNMKGTIGDGGRELQMETVNGSIHLKSGG